MSGVFPVTGPDGVPVATIRSSRWHLRSFRADTPAGEPLCSGRSRIRNLYWDVDDGQGTRIVTLYRGASLRPSTITLAGGRVLTLIGSTSSPTWRVVDAGRNRVLDAELAVDLPSAHPHAWQVRCHDRTLTLAQVVGVVETRRHWSRSYSVTN